MVNRSLVVIALLLAASAAKAGIVTIDPDASPRVRYGAEKLEASLQRAGIDRGSIVVTQAGGEAKAEGFSLRSDAGGGGAGGGAGGAGGAGRGVSVIGNDDSGAMYGCLDLARRISNAKKLPTDLHVTEAPAMKYRGPCIGMQ